jgi:urea transport system ATP-binding protein
MEYAVKGERHDGRVTIVARGFVSREDAEDYPIRLSNWKRVRVEEVAPILYDAASYVMRPDRDLAPFVDYFARFPILARRLEQHAGTLSGGEKKLLSLTRGLAEGRPVILLDEPSEGVQWENILHMTALIEQRKAAGTALIVVEQNLAFAERIADHYLVMDQGRIVLAGAAADIDRAQLLAHLHV